MYEVKQQRFSPLSVRGGSQSREILYHVGTWPMHTCISTRGAGVTRPVSIGGGHVATRANRVGKGTTMSL